MVFRTLRRPAHATVVAYVALVLAMGGTAVAATGGTFLLGKANGAGRTTSLVNSGKGAALRVAAHNLSTPPLSVGLNKTRIHNLNADFLDGLTSAQLQRRVSGTCANGSSITAVRAGGGVACGARIMWAVVNADGSLARGTSGVASSKVGTGQYNVTFSGDVSQCAQITGGGLADNAGVAPVATTGTSTLNGNPKGVFVATYKEANGAFGAQDAGFHLLVVC
ncbi:MAG TPA: hypothetical protein VFH66_07410 [Mycobacteriales bacterium]|nr:hypothetical protein [Mycobacteriales bacterium]